MKPKDLAVELDALLRHGITDPVLIMGAPGIGKTSIVRQVVRARGMRVWDVRWGQLLPADARGVPVPVSLDPADAARGVTLFYPPAFWPREGLGVIFLDEFNQSTPSMMGLAQQLLLDRKFGDYVVPDGIVVWAAGNRKSDGAAVHEIPGPVNNRVAHYDVEIDFPSWEEWAYRSRADGGGEIDTKIISFLRFRQVLLHKFKREDRAWPSPRSWEMANRRLKAEMSLDPVIGVEVGSEFAAFIRMLDQLPNIDLIVAGKGARVSFPDDPSIRHAVVVELTRRSLDDPEKFHNSILWLVDKARSEPDWISAFAQDYVRLVRQTKAARESNAILTAILEIPELKRFKISA